jgi:ribosomal protein S18 acetylase RimI-like enzyme
MFVDKSWRGMGIGRALLAHIASKGSEVGASRLTLKVLEMNSRALAFYRRHGFDIIGTEHDSYLLMEARINDVIQMTRLSPDRQ